MGCLGCVHYEEGYDGEYGSAYSQSCNANMPVSQLKGFPFKRVPKSCKTVFRLNPMSLPSADRYFHLLGVLCGKVCNRCDIGLQADGADGCNTSSCDAFLYFEGYTAVNVDDLTEEFIRKHLSDKKMFYQTNNNGRKPFAASQWESCPSCDGKDSVQVRGTHFDVCETCLGRGHVKRGNSINPEAKAVTFI